MAKEKYKDALTGAFNQFITPPEPEPKAKTPPTIEETPPAILEQPIQKNRLTPTEKAERKARAKQNAQYIGSPPAMYKAATDAQNPRGRRVQLLFRANIHAELLAIAHAQGRSLNNLIEEILTDYLNGGRK